jgi:hypothetical protein
MPRPDNPAATPDSPSNGVPDSPVAPQDSNTPQKMAWEQPRLFRIAADEAETGGDTMVDGANTNS